MMAIMFRLTRLLPLVVCALFVFATQPALAQLAGSLISGSDVVSGKEFSFDTSKAKLGTVLVFLSAHCPCSQSHETMLRELAKKHTEFQFVGIHSNADETPSDTKAHFQKAALPFPVLQDRNSALAERFKALKTPHVFLINGKGETLYAGGVSDSHVGEQARNQYLRDALNDVQEGHAPKRAWGRTLGCVIARNSH